MESQAIFQAKSQAKNVSIELPHRGKYLERGRVAKPQRRVDGEPDYYDIDDFYIGEIPSDDEMG